jgi:hypothetical protein
MSQLMDGHPGHETSSVFESGTTLINFVKQYNDGKAAYTGSLAAAVLRKAEESGLPCTITQGTLLKRLQSLKEKHRSSVKLRDVLEASPQENILLHSHHLTSSGWQVSTRGQSSVLQENNPPPQGMHVLFNLQVLLI